MAVAGQSSVLIGKVLITIQALVLSAFDFVVALFTYFAVAEDLSNLEYAFKAALIAAEIAPPFPGS